MYELGEGFKFANISDLHLYDREIGATIGYGEESERNLKKVLSYYTESDMDFLILGGDIQHGMPEDMRQMSRWRALLIELRERVYEKLEETGLIDKMKVFDSEGIEMDIRNDHSCLFSLKGNHDYNRRRDRKDSFTFFDDLVEAGIISVPKKIVIGNTQLNLYSSEECMYPVNKEEGIETVVALYHDPIIQDGRLADKYLGKMISPDKHKFFNEVDLAILNDIHLPITPYEVITVGEDGVGTATTVLTPGSIGRTSFSDSHKRDYALIAEVDVDSGGDMEYTLSEIDILPYKELFDYEQVIKVKKRENMFEQFSLEIEKVDKVKRDPRDEVKDMDLDEDVKGMCMVLLDEVVDGIK